MTLQDIYNILSSVAPAHYHHAPKGTKLPFITYTSSHDNNFSADDKVYQLVTSITVVLYLGVNDLPVEDSLNRALDDADLYWVSSPDYDNDQKLFTITYEMEVI